MEGLIYVTAKGKKILEDRRAELIAMREEIAHKIREAREFGDLKENSEYVTAREEQSNLEDEVHDIEIKLQNLKIFNPAKVDTSVVNVGTKVQIQSGTKAPVEWIITGVIENDPSNRLISNETPIAKALLGKKVGEMGEIHTAVGVQKYKITKISAGA